MLPEGDSGQDPWSTILSSLGEVRAGWPSRGWSWDARVGCVVSSFSTEFEIQASIAAGLVLSQVWTPSTIKQAPGPLRVLAWRTGGLREGQRMLASAPVGGGFAYGLWWPWEDGMTISARIGLGGLELRPKIHEQLRDAFRVQL
jgi:hypothetical protein